MGTWGSCGMGSAALQFWGPSPPAGEAGGYTEFCSEAFWGVCDCQELRLGAHQ